MPAGGRRVKVIVDTNILIGFLIGKRLRGLESALKSERFIIVVSPLLIEELTSVAARPSFRKYFPAEDVVRLIAFLRRYGRLFEAQRPETPLCRDPEDDFLLTLARKSKADVLVTGDKDLLDMSEFEGTLIMSASKFTAAYL